MSKGTQERKISMGMLVVIFIVYAIVFAVPNYGQYQLSALGAQVMEQYGLTFVQFNSLFTAPMIPAILTSVIGGMLVDRFGYKPVIAVTIAITVAGCWMRLIATNYAMMFIAMFMLGFSAGFCTSNSSKILTLIYGESKMAVMAGLVLSFSTCTLVLSMATTALLGMKLAFTITGIVSTAGLILWLIFMPHLKNTAPAAEGAAAAPAEDISMGAAFKLVMKNKYVWLAGLSAFCINGAMAAFGSMLPQAMQNVYGFTESAAGLVGAFTMVGNLLGSTFTPSLCQKTGKFRLILMLCGLLSVVLSAFSWRLTGVWLYVGQIALGYAYGSGMASVLTLAIRMPGIGPKVAGTAGGLVATIQLLGGVFLPTYIASPIAGSSYSAYFIVIGASSFVWILSIFLMPRSLDVKA